MFNQRDCRTYKNLQEARAINNKVKLRIEDVLSHLVVLNNYAVTLFSKELDSEALVEMQKNMLQLLKAALDEEK